MKQVKQMTLSLPRIHPGFIHEEADNSLREMKAMGNAYAPHLIKEQLEPLITHAELRTSEELTGITIFTQEARPQID